MWWSIIFSKFSSSPYSPKSRSYRRYSTRSNWVILQLKLVKIYLFIYVFFRVVPIEDVAKEYIFMGDGADLINLENSVHYNTRYGLTICTDGACGLVLENVSTHVQNHHHWKFSKQLELTDLMEHFPRNPFEDNVPIQGILTQSCFQCTKCDFISKSEDGLHRHSYSIHKCKGNFVSITGQRYQNMKYRKVVK